MNSEIRAYISFSFSVYISTSTKLFFSIVCLSVFKMEFVFNQSTYSIPDFSSKIYFRTGVLLKNAFINIFSRQEFLVGLLCSIRLMIRGLYRGYLGVMLFVDNVCNTYAIPNQLNRRTDPTKPSKLISLKTPVQKKIFHPLLVYSK